MARSIKIRTTATGLVAVACLCSGVLRASVGIKPAFVDVKMDDKRPAGSFLIANVGDKEERFRVNAVHFIYTEKGALVASETGENSLAPWIRFNPRELTIAPKTQRAVRFAVVPREPLKQGEYWAAMELESLEVNETVAKNDQTGRAVKLRTAVAILAPIFGTVGDVTYEGQIKDIQVVAEHGAIVLKVLVATTGTGRLGLVGDYEVVDASGQVVHKAQLGAAYVLRGAQRWLSRPVQGNMPRGEYTVRVSFTAAHLKQPLTHEARVTWPDAPAPEAQKTAGPVQPGPAEETADEAEGPTDGGR